MIATAGRAAISSANVPLSLLTLFSGILWKKQAKVEDGDCYDYIIIGSGAGSVLANRLTEDKSVSALLVEAGNVPSIESILPGLFVLPQNSYQDWQCKSEKEMASQSQSGDVFKVSIGKTLGGTSCINHFIYLRGHPSDYNLWAEATNDSSWKYDHITQYFKKCEHIDDEEIMNSEYAKFHSTDGPIVITRVVYDSADKYFKAFEEVGKNVVLDLNGDNTTGYAHSTLTIGNNVRQSLAQAYLRPIIDRPNLHISYNTLATKINFDEEKNAVSVDIIKDGKKITVKAAREIILSAGAIKSPQLLMLSGIGLKAHLESFNIPVIQDLPVGQNMQDHVLVQLVHKMETSLEISELPTLTTIPFPLIIGAVNVNKSDPYPHYQSTNIILTHDLPYLILACVQLLGYKDEICNDLHKAATLRNTLVSLVADLKPLSRGIVKLRSRDPKDCPIVFQNIYCDERDLDNMVGFVEDFIKVGQSKYFKKVNAELVALQFEDCTGDFSSKDYIRCYAKHMSTSMFHQCGTCAMGTVLDSSLKVKGVKRLRVIDASAFPTITRANPLASVVMMAEKGADMIKQDQCNTKPICTKKSSNQESESVIKKVPFGSKFL